MNYDKMRFCFYKDTVKEFIKDNKTSILIIAGNECDRDVFLELGFNNVVISNIDASLNEERTHPYKFILQDVHHLTFGDDSFDYAVVQGALHHCRSPHRALLEMYRVAKVGVLAIESRDSLLTRLAQKLKLTEAYEIRSVCEAERGHGGMDNTEVPNHIYRWTENEVEKTIASFAPHAKHEIRYRYGLSVPTSFESFNILMRMAIIAAMPFFKLFFLLMPRQQNLFAFFVKKPVLQKDLFPWLSRDNHGRLAFNINRT